MTVRPAKTKISLDIRPVWSVFALRSMGSKGPKLSSCGQRRLWSDWADAQADLCLRWEHIILLGLSWGGSNYNTDINDNANNCLGSFKVSYLNLSRSTTKPIKSHAKTQISLGICDLWLWHSPEIFSLVFFDKWWETHLWVVSFYGLGTTHSPYKWMICKTTT